MSRGLHKQARYFISLCNNRVIYFDSFDKNTISIILAVLSDDLIKMFHIFQCDKF